MATSHRPDIYNQLLDHATLAGQWEYRFWRDLITALDHDWVSVDEARELAGRLNWHSTSRPSRATLYRQVAKWRPVLADLKDPGRGV